MHIDAMNANREKNSEAFAEQLAAGNETLRNLIERLNLARNAVPELEQKCRILRIRIEDVRLHGEKHLASLEAALNEING